MMGQRYQPQDSHYSGPSIQIDGPLYEDDQWKLSIAIGPRHKTFYGSTQKGVHDQMEMEIEKQIEELEASKVRLRKLLGT